MNIERKDPGQDKEGLVDEAVRAIREVRIPEGPPAEVVESVLAAGNREQSKFAKGRFRMNRIMKIAAGILIVVGIGAVIGLLTQSSGMASVAWANVLKNAEQARTVSFRLKASMTGMPDSEIMVYDSSEYGSRMDVYVNGKVTTKLYGPKGKNVAIMVIPGAKRYTRMPLTAEQLKQEKDPREFVKLFLSVEHTELGRKTIDGIEVEGLEVDSPKVGGGMFESAVGRLWADVKTNLPVRMEIEGVSGGGKIQTKMVIDKFKWDEKLSADEFEPNIPDDYILWGETKTPEVSKDK